jgi:hypothetical protein
MVKYAILNKRVSEPASRAEGRHMARFIFRPFAANAAPGLAGYSQPAQC